MRFSKVGMPDRSIAKDQAGRESMSITVNRLKRGGTDSPLRMSVEWRVYPGTSTVTSSTSYPADFARSTRSRRISGTFGA